jgi:Transposase and inactivated derivatives
MDYQSILLSAKLLSTTDQARLISDLLGQSQEDYLSLRRQQFIDKQAYCPCCGSKKYNRYGIDKGSQRFRCKECSRTFTEYTGTWLDGLHKKGQVIAYIELMIEGKSLDKISAKLGINKKTAFDWRHKILSSLPQDKGNELKGIIESDETFFEESDKGSKHLTRPGRRRGSSTSPSCKKKRGISNNKAAVIATLDRQGGINLCVATMGRISKDDIVRSIVKPFFSMDTVLCTDSHVSYKGFAIDNKLEHIALRTNLNQHVKHGIYHIQNVNSIHNKMKKWIDNTFWGVSTKYLQNYLGWFRLNEKLKNSANIIKEFISQTMRDTDTLKRYGYIDVSYQWLLATQN